MMKLKWLALFLVLSGLISVNATAQKFPSENLFYMTGSHNSFESFRKNVNLISIVCPAAYSIDKYGTISGGVDPRVLKIAKEHDVKVMPLFGWADQAGIHQLLNDPDARARAIQIMLFDARQYDYYGWQMDIEHVHVTDDAAYTDFFRQSADSLHKYGYKLTMALIKSDSPVPHNGNSSYNRFLYEDWRGDFDVAKLAKIADFLSVMTYDQHTALTPPGPVAGIPWMKKMADYLVSQGVNPKKISFGLPSYSDYWFPTYSENQGAHSTRDEISYQRVQDLLERYQAKPEWMADQGVDYARWTDANGVFSWLFIENARSFSDKLDLIPKYHFRGISVWVLGTEDPGIWKVLKEKTTPVHY